MPSTRRTAPAPETRTLEKPNARNFLAISALSANRSTELRARVARYRFPSWTVKSPAKLALPKVAVIAKAAIAYSNMRKVLLVIVDVLLLLVAEILFGRPLPPTALPPYARCSDAQREDIALLSELAEAGSLR